MDWLVRTRHALPVAVLVFFTVVDQFAVRGQVVLSLLVIAPLVAASTLSRRATATYAALAFVLAVLLGVANDQYQGEALVAQLLRMFGVALGGGLAVVACMLRQRQEQLVRRLSEEAAASRGAVQLAESLQRSLLSDPTPVPGLGLAARYVPAGRHAGVGGDWYDAFGTPDGATMLVIGDVAGHDVSAAATMAGTRGLLRGIAATGLGSPGAVLRSLDEAMDRLDVGTLVTATVATLRPGAGGTAHLCWSNAGHPPPVLVRAGGEATLLTRPVDVLLGVGCRAERSDHELTLAAGDTLLLYTDGLVERRGADLDVGTAWLLDELAALAGAPLDDLCGRLLAGAPGTGDDDVAVLAVRVG